MSRLNKIMLVMTSAILAATLSFGLIVFGDLKDMEAWLVGGVIFLLVAQTHSTLARASERKLFVKNIADINSFASGLNRDLERAEADIEVLTERLETETKTRNEEIVAEMRVIESFVKRLAEERQPAKKIAASQQANRVVPLPGVASPAVPVDQLNDADLLDVIRHAQGEIL